MAPLVQSVTDFLSFIVVLLDIFGVFALFVLVTPLRKRGWTKAFIQYIGERALLLSFLVILGSVVASLFYSDVANFQPCLLCWWQRIFLYPQAILLPIALIKRDQLMRLYALALSSIGILISIYHTYLQFGGESLFPCAASGATCEHVYFLNYGYVTIPTMALTAFALIIIFTLAPNPEKKVLRGF
jgi:disulfide bond formation protein DsbB